MFRSTTIGKALVKTGNDLEFARVTTCPTTGGDTTVHEESVVGFAHYGLAGDTRKVERPYGYVLARIWI